MHLVYMLLTVAALLRPCSASMTAGYSVAGLAQGGNDKRLLRGNQKYNVDSAMNVAADEERAGQGLFNKILGRNDLKMEKLSRMMNDEAFKMKMFKNWDNHHQSIGKIRENMVFKRNPHYKKLLVEYLNEFKRTSPKVKKFKPSKPSTGNRVRFS
ncbi:secreted RxLR effector peptide protein, putative [Phytophthora infestans T30-4]|uniref:RxLR effector protein n=1 Tax=Phytophthora infestans (strain T30-4) TaxID=403677 RepID=D0NK97_PHYIT|nr:secreted RxLR effector peptide protein, putative [Phytophthora infestans T30-4]EEY59934.1 secreted RxLR effector peptide protein, putative [Phytophthora infestans T30-4]|eukprot:XP_002900619.1 secreted RxLR effector peptide protein, putative [Phytophthora infestans T30-4]